jgi:hypothetical protein
MGFPQEPAGFIVTEGMSGTLINKFIRNLFAISRIHTGKEDYVIDSTAAVIIPVVQLTPDRNMGTETYAAFPAPVTFKNCHCR